MMRVRVFNEHPARRIQRAEIARVARRVLKGERKRHGDITVVFVDGKTMKRMNGRYLKHWSATDVLSFPLSEDPAFLEGEVYVNTDQAVHQAREYRVTFLNECSRLVAHGILHLVGFDDKTRRATREMAAREDLYLFPKKKNGT